MSKKSMVVVSIVALIAVVLIAVTLATFRKTSSPNTITTSSTKASATATGTTGTSTAQASTTSSTSGLTSPGSISGSPNKSAGTQANLDSGPLKPMPRLPDPGIPAETLTSPANSGQTLAPLLEAPASTIYALKLGEVFSRGQYTIVMRPYGLGPDSIWGSGLVIRVDSAKPVGSEPVNNKIVNANLLVTPDTTNGGTVTKGGTYAATITFRSDGSKLLPILSQVTLVK